MPNRKSQRGIRVKDEIAGALAAAAGKTAPPVIVAAVTADELVKWGTLAWIGLQSAYLLWRWFRDWRRKGDRDDE